MATVQGSRIIRSASDRDSVLEEGFERRESWAFEAAYRHAGARLYSTARYILRNEALAQECVHDTFLRLWRGPAKYDRRRGALQAFLVTCVRNEALSRARNDARRAEISARLTEEVYHVDEDPLERERIATAMKRLSLSQARSIELAYFRGLTFSEVAAELGEPLGTIKSRIASALRVLRRELCEDGISG